MKDDPRERVETEHIKCSFSVAGLWLIESDREDIYPCIPWPELVELAQKILAADEAWLDANTPTLEELRAKYPEWNLDLVTTEFHVIAMYEYRELETGCGCGDVMSEPQGIRWLAAKLEEPTDE